MDFKDLADFCQAQALADKLYPTEQAVWRSFCRQYSKLYSTPLHLVEEMEPAKVLIAVYEDQLDDLDIDNNLEQIFDLIYSLEDPDYAKSKRDEFKRFIKESEEEEELRQEEGRPIHKLLAEDNEVSLRKDTSKVPPTPNKKLPQGGGVNLSYLEREEIEQGDGDF